VSNTTFMTEILLTRTTLIALLLAESKLPRIPAEPWPLAGAIETLASDPDSGRLNGAAIEWLAPRPSPKGRVEGVTRWVRESCEAGRLKPEGEGWNAGYRPVGDWIERARVLRERLDERERVALRQSAHRLVAMASMLSKNAAA
jgi:hypothetical protein